MKYLIELPEGFECGGNCPMYFNHYNCLTHFGHCPLPNAVKAVEVSVDHPYDQVSDLIISNTEGKQIEGVKALYAVESHD